MKIWHQLFLVFFLLISTEALALNAQLYRPFFPDARTMSVYESKTKPARTFSFGLDFEYQLHPFEFGNSNNNARTGSIIDHLYTLDLGLAYAITDRMAVGIGVPLHITNGIQSVTNLTENTLGKLGDISIGGQYTLIDRDSKYNGLGLAFMPYLTFPTGSAGRFLGDTNVTGGFILASDLELFEEHFIGLNVGMRFRQTETVTNLTVGQELTYGAGYEHYIWPSQNLNGFVELIGQVSLSQTQEINSPVNLNFGVNKTFLQDQSLRLTVASGIGLGSGYGTSDYRGLVRLAYNHQMKEKEKVKPAPIPEVRVQKVERLLKELTIYYPTDGAQVDPFYDEKIAGIAKILSENRDLAPLYILGHTDDIASDAYNSRLSQRRAKQAYESILAHGVDSSLVIYQGFGEQYPVVPNVDDASRALNRRTLFTFVKPHYMGGTGHETVPSKNDSYTEILRQREGTFSPEENNKLQTKRKKVRPDLVIEEQVKVEKEYDPREEYKKQKKFESKKKGEDSYTDYLKKNNSTEVYSEPQVIPQDTNHQIKKKVSSDEDLYDQDYYERKNLEEKKSKKTKKNKKSKDALYDESEYEELNKEFER